MTEKRAPEFVDGLKQGSLGKPSNDDVASLKMRMSNPKSFAALIIAANVVALALYLGVFRWVILRGEMVGQDLQAQIVLLGFGGLQDMMFVSALGCLALIASRTARPLGVARAFKWLCAFFALWGASNILAMDILAEPVTWAWITYADLLNSTYALDSVFHLVDLRFAVILLVLMMGFFALQYALAALFRWIDVANWAAISLTILPILAWSVPTFVASDPGLLSRGQKLNPAIALFQSVVSPPSQRLGLVATDTGIGVPSAPDVAYSKPIERPDTERFPIRNVVLFVLETVPARFVEDYGSPYPVTPNLTAYRDKALRFERTYTPTPASNYALFGLTTSVVPEIKAVSPQQDHPGRDYLAVGDVLQDAGFRTGFFASTDNRFDRREEYLPFAGYETIEDYRNWSCDTGFFGDDGPGYHNTGPDRCTVPPVLDWIDKKPDQPFFATFWTGQPHYPYFVEGEPELRSGREDLDRFLSAVSAADNAFGLMMDGLVERDLLKDTLVVVIGDHGEAFGEHGTNGHASSVYEENLRVPLYLIHPDLFHGETAASVASTIDVAPTILDLLDLPRPDIWQGQSLFGETHWDGAIFFSPWNGFQVGFVDGDTKVIYNVSTEKLEIFDLSSDPQERENLALVHPDLVEPAREKLSIWLNWQASVSARFAGASADVKNVPLDEDRRISIFATGTYFETYPRADIFIDDRLVGSIQISKAPGNAEREIDVQEQKAALRQYFIENTGDRCGRNMRIMFLNDEWAGEDLPGDTNLSLKWVEVDGTYYFAKHFKLETKGAGGYWDDIYTMYKKGTVNVGLSPSADCIAGSLAKSEN